MYAALWMRSVVLLFDNACDFTEFTRIPPTASSALAKVRRGAYVARTMPDR